jgi:membrane protein implicated in regulation of membrane protease activity
VHHRAPANLILTTMVCLVLVNLLAAQVVLRLFYPASPWQFGLATLLALAVLSVVAVVATLRGWRAYLRLLRRPRDA